jgi:hypothetical protein
MSGHYEFPPIPELTEAQKEANRQINAHLHTAGRHIERGNDDKAEEHLIAATQHCEANGIPHFGRYNVSAIHARQARHDQREHERQLKNREIPS